MYQGAHIDTNATQSVTFENLEIDNITVISSFFRWEAYIGNEKSVDVSHKAVYHISYEPFYITSQNIPSYDERFEGYGNTRNSQVCRYSIHVSIIK